MVDLKKSVRALLIVAVYAICALRCEAQFIGYISSQSTTQTVFTNQAANATSAVLTNLGQSSHFLTICNNLFVGTVSLEASPDGNFGASSTTTLASGSYALPSGPGDTGCHLLQAGGYYPAERVRVSNFLSGTTTVTYAGIGSPISVSPSALNSQGPASPIACDFGIGPSSIAQNTAATNLQAGITGQRIYVCSITISFSAATTTGTIQFLSSSGSCLAATQAYTLNITASTPQIVHLLGGPGGLFRLAPGQQLCVSTGALTAQTLLDISFTQF
jgi:hypothetical protein